MSANIEKWEDRLPLCPSEEEIHQAKDAELVDLRAALAAKMEDQQSTDLMAECMSMVRSDLIEASIIDKTVPPMMVSDAVCAHIQRLAKAVPAVPAVQQGGEAAEYGMDEVDLAKKILLFMGHSGSTPREPGAGYYTDRIAAMIGEYRAKEAPPPPANLVPGKMHCARCDFSLIRKKLYLQSGTVGAGGNETEPCPNGCGPLWPVTWEQEARDGYKLMDNLFERAKKAEDALAAVPAVQQGGEAAPAEFQARAQPWLLQCFGPVIAADTMERNHRFFEESTELVQACGMTASEAHQLVDYVFGRPVGEPAQEVGGVMVTLAALCLAQKIDMHEAGEVELARVWTKVDQIRAKQAAKPKHSPLPQHVAAAPCDRDAVIEEAALLFPQPFVEHCGTEIQQMIRAMKSGAAPHPLMDDKSGGK